jgi:dTDP-4-dehydrorhamnose reductase
LKIVVTGAGGQLGSDLVRVLGRQSGQGVQLHALTSTQLDITDHGAITQAFNSISPDVIINAAAYTAVDQAETDIDRAFAVNATAPALLAVEAARIGARLIHVSTDYVFNGDATLPYEVDAATDPQSVYGRTKRGGEEAVLAFAPELGYIVRTAWVYGAVGANFVKTMAKLQASRDTVQVVEDQCGSPTWSADLAAALVELATAAAPAGIYHCTNADSTTWYGFTRAIFEELGADPGRVQPTTSAAFVRPAPRPAYSVLSSRAWIQAGLSPLRDWRSALAAAFAECGDSFRPAS